MKHHIAAILCAILLTAANSAYAQTLPLEQGIRFALKPRQGLSLRPLLPPAGPRPVDRIDPLDRVNADDRGLDIQIGLQRQTRRFAISEPATLLTLATLPRSRLTRYTVEDHLVIGDHLAASFGWHGIKLSNRNANVTIGAGNDRLRAHDWFLPRAALKVQADRSLAVTLGYSETLGAYGETGVSGPMGLTREAFRALGQTLKSETRSRTQLGVDWAATSALAFSIKAHRGRVDDRLAFAGRSAIPVNSGSARVSGVTLEASHRMSPNLRWSLRYGAAQLHLSGAHAVRERSLVVEGVWENGPWRASARVGRNSAPAFEPLRQHGLQVEAGVDYAFATIGRRPLRLSVRMIDPDRLVSTDFVGNDLSDIRRAADQARGVMASARFDW